MWQTLMASHTQKNQYFPLPSTLRRRRSYAASPPAQKALPLHPYETCLSYIWYTHIIPHIQAISQNNPHIIKDRWFPLFSALPAPHAAIKSAPHQTASLSGGCGGSLTHACKAPAARQKSSRTVPYRRLKNRRYLQD